MNSLYVKKKSGARMIKSFADLFIFELLLLKNLKELFIMYLGSFLPASCCRYLLFLIDGQCLESETVEEKVMFLFAAYINTDICTHVDMHTLTPNTDIINAFLLFIYLFIHSIAH